MVNILRIPKLGLSDYAEVVSWEIEIGADISEGDIAVILESEKASAEIESPTDGVLLGTYVSEGEEIEINVGKPLGVIGAEGESVPDLEDIEGKGATDDRGPADTDSADSAVTETTSNDTDDIKATPRAKRRANESGINLSSIEGTGPQGAITTDDIDRFESEADTEASEGSASEPDPEPKMTPRATRRLRSDETPEIPLEEVEGTGPQGAITEEDIDRYLSELSKTDKGEPDKTELTVAETRTLTGTRGTIAERLSRSAREKPHVMGTREISIERLKHFQDHLEERHDVDVSLNDLILFFVGRTLQDLPAFNAHFEDEAHKLIEEINLGYAVDGPRGLVVPVLSDVADESITELAANRRDAVRRVLDGEYTAADLKGGTFTVTNVGVFEMDVSYSIINPPEVAILAIGRRKHAPVERDGNVEFEEVITFSLTIDHRVLDGADSGAFLEQLNEYLEYPGTALEEV